MFNRIFRMLSTGGGGGGGGKCRNLFVLLLRTGSRHLGAITMFCTPVPCGC